jgi:hypothetical protein
VLSLARLGSVIVPGVGLVLTAATVAAVALVVTMLPKRWRPGPRIGSAAVGAGVLLAGAGIALVEAGQAVAASTPFWRADLAAWPDRVGAFAPYGAAVPVSLLLAAIAAFLLLPRSVRLDVCFVVVGLAALSVPAVFQAPWWSAPALSGLFAAAAGVGAAAVRAAGPSDPAGRAAAVASRRLLLAGVLSLYAVVTGSATPAGTATVLAGVVATGALVAALATLGPGAPSLVTGAAVAAALAAGPGSAATTAVAAGAGRSGVLATALGVCALGLLVIAGLRPATGVPDGPAGGVGDAAFGLGLATVAIAVGAILSAPGAGLGGLTGRSEGATSDAPIWAAACALVATLGAALAAAPRRDRPPPRVVAMTIAVTAVPAAAFAAVASTPAWFTAIAGPYRTLRDVWSGYALVPQPRGAAVALVTLLLLTPVAGGIALTIGGRRYLLPSILPTLAAAAVVLPAALGLSREATPWVALGVALATGIAAATSPPRLPTAATMLRGSAGVVCLLTGGAGLAGSLAAPGTTLAALAIIAAGGLAAAVLGRDPAARTVAWAVFAGAGFALPATAFAAMGRDPRPAAFWILGLSAVLVALAFVIAPRRPEDADVAEAAAGVGAAIALALAWGSIPHAAAVLTVVGLLSGAAALRRDLSPDRRAWLVRLALAAELAACWLLLYGVHIGLPEAYTLPFAAVALLAGALELRRRPELNSWLAYGPALAGAFAPSVALILVGDDPVWRWVSVFLAAVATVILGTWRGRRAPVVAGAAVAVVVAVVEMIWLLIAGQIAGAVFVALAGATLIVFGALAERRLRRPAPADPASPALSRPTTEPGPTYRL